MLPGLFQFRFGFGLLTIIFTLLSSHPWSAIHAQEPNWVTWERSLTHPQRQMMQEGLVWAGHYLGLLDGDIGPLSRRAIESVQASRGLAATGVLSWADAQHLWALTAASRQSTGLAPYFDAATGIAIALPYSRFPNDPEIDVRYGDVSSLFIAPGGGAALTLWRSDAADDQVWQMLHDFALRTADGAPARVEYDLFRANRLSVWTSYGSQRQYYYGHRQGHSARVMMWNFDAELSDVFTPLAILSTSYFAPFGGGISLIDAPLPEPPQGYVPPAASLPASTEAGVDPGLSPVPPSTVSPELIGSGSGFLINGAGQIVTNAHVIEGCGALRVSQAGRGPDPATVMAIDRYSDLALLVSGWTETPFMTLRDLPRPQIGEPVMVAGFPLSVVLGNSLSVTTGTLSALSGIDGDTQHYRITAPVQPGNSGGPVLDAYGGVIGVTVATLDERLPAQNVNFAIKSSVLRTFLDSHAIDYEINPSSVEIGQVNRGALAGRASVFVECLAP